MIQSRLDGEATITMNSKCSEENVVKIPRALRICSWVVSLLTALLAIMSFFSVGPSAFNFSLAIAGWFQLRGLYTGNGELLVLKAVGIELFMLGLLIWPFMFPPPEANNGLNPFVWSEETNIKLLLAISWCCVIWWLAAKCFRMGKLSIR